MDVYNGTYTAEIGKEQNYPEEFMRKNDETTETQRVVFEVMVRRGMTPMEAIRSATSLAAQHMDMANDVGAIEVGRYGDLIAVKGNPLQDITLLQDVAVVVKGGEVLKLVTDRQT